MAFSLRLFTNNSRIAPASGVKRTSDSSGKLATLLIDCTSVAARSPDQQVDAQAREDAEHHQQRVVLDEAGLNPPEHEAPLVQDRSHEIDEAIHDVLVDQVRD